MPALAVPVVSVQRIHPAVLVSSVKPATTAHLAYTFIEYGECGVGAYCLGGCNPVYSHSLDSCAPEPKCSNRDITFKNMDRLISENKYLGNASSADFVYSGEPLIYNDEVLLTMTETNSGTLLASTEYVWYGKVTANLSTSGGDGVVTAFIMLSDVKDEIDFEFVGYNLTQAQTNFYWQGVENYNNGGNSSVSSNTMQNFHIYEFDWQPDSITWSVDGSVVRTLQKSSTFNSSTNQYNYPQTPSRIELSVWPAGAQGNSPGTVTWAGGYINWNDTTYMTNGYYYAAFSSISVQCYDPPTGANSTGNDSYIYTGTSGLNNTVAITSENTILDSDLSTGTNTTIPDPSESSASASSVSNVPTGQSSSGTGSNGDRGGSSSSSSSATSTGFVQGSGSGSGSSKSAASTVKVMGQGNERLLMGSALGVVAVLAWMMVL